MKTPITPLYGLTIALLTSATLLPHADAQQILAPGPDNTTIAEGDILFISNGESGDNNLDAFIIASAGTLDNDGTLNNNLGGTLINNGTLNNNKDGTLNNNGGTLDNSGTLINSGTLNLNGGSLTTASLDNTAGGTFNFNTGTLGITDVNQTLTIGVEHFSLTNGTTFNTNAGITTLSANQHLEIAGATNIASDGTFTLNGGSLTTASLDNTAGGTFNFNTGTLGITDVNQTLTIGVEHFSLTNGTTFNTNAGITTLAANQHLEIAGAAHLASGASLTMLGGTFSSGSFTSAGAMAVNTGGTLDNSETLLSSGTLTNNGTIQGDVTAQAGSSLSGNGTFNGKTIIEAGATQSPGNSPGTQTFNELVWQDGADYLWEINADTTNSGTRGDDPGWDWISVTNDWDISAITTSFDIDITSLTSGNIAGLADGFDNTGLSYGGLYESFTILSFGSLVGTFDAAKFNLVTSNFANSGVGWSIDLVGNDLVLSAINTVSAVPEPSSTALLGIGGLALMLRRRR